MKTTPALVALRSAGLLDFGEFALADPGEHGAGRGGGRGVSWAVAGAGVTRVG